MKRRLLCLLLMIAAILLIFLLVSLTKTTCPLCGRPVYFYILQFCRCALYIE